MVAHETSKKRWKGILVKRRRGAPPSQTTI
jgi:hypothetical protein